MLLIKPLDVFFEEQNLKLESDVLKQINSICRKIGLEFNMDDGPWIAGGAVLKLAEGRKLGKRDFDIFFKEESQFKQIRKLLDKQAELEEQKFDKEKNNENKKYFSGYGRPVKSNVYESSQALTYSLDYAQVQIIRRYYYNSVYELLGDFDFTICQFATDGREIAYTEQSLADMKAKSLRLHYAHRNSTLIRRYYKYMANGYTPLPGQSRLMHEIVREDPFQYAIEAGKYGK